MALMRAHYMDIISCVRVDGDVSNWFDIKSGVRHLGVGYQLDGSSVRKAETSIRNRLNELHLLG